MIPSIRSKAAVVGVAILTAASASGVAHAAGPNYPPVLKPVSCVAYTNSSASVLKVNMGPNLKKSRYYSFTVEKLVNNVWVQVGPTYKTKGKKETRTINLPRGTYQVQCQGKYNRGPATSNIQGLLK